MSSVALQLILCGLVTGQAPALANLDFSAGTLAGWEGEGFTLEMKNGVDPALAYSVTSKDSPGKGQSAALHRALVVPHGAGVIRFSACAVRGKDCQADENLDVVLMAAGRRVIPKRVRTDEGWQHAGLLAAKEGQPREYIWPVTGYVGKWVRIVILDDDKRPGCYVHCSGFRLQTQNEFEASEFGKDVVGLAGRNKLAPMVPYSSQHFAALSNADEDFSESRLKLCEMMFGQYYEHLRQKGFALYSPASKLLVSMFDSQAGFEAYLERKMPPEVSGLYQLRSNRLVMYDFGQNESFVSKKQQALRNGQKINLQMERLRYLDGVQRQAREFRADANTATIMHEVAHQLSFNCGMLNRDGDVPLWLAEGLACYCEATADGFWQGIGEMNQQRLATLADALHSKQPLFTLRQLLESDRWVRAAESKTILLGYAQSWALFRMLIEEQPSRLRAYFKLIYAERISERRIADFQQAFGYDLLGLERHYQDYIKDQIQQHLPSRR